MNYNNNYLLHNAFPFLHQPYFPLGRSGLTEIGSTKGRGIYNPDYHILSVEVELGVRTCDEARRVLIRQSKARPCEGEGRAGIVVGMIAALRACCYQGRAMRLEQETAATSRTES